MKIELLLREMWLITTCLLSATTEESDLLKHAKDWVWAERRSQNQLELEAFEWAWAFFEFFFFLNVLDFTKTFYWHLGIYKIVFFGLLNYQCCNFFKEYLSKV